MVIGLLDTPLDTPLDTLLMADTARSRTHQCARADKQSARAASS
jgi:hypothetical protein